MQLTWNEIRDRAIKFAMTWKDAHNEEAQARQFMLDFLGVFGVSRDTEGAEGFFTGGHFENRIAKEDGHKGYFDLLWGGKIAIEMKSRGKDLAKAYGQLKDYAIHLPQEQMPPLLMVSDFEYIHVYHRETGINKRFKTKDLKDNIRRFSAIAGYEASREYDPQIDVNVKASEKMAKLHDALKANGYFGHELEVYLVRLLFCLFADDTGIFPSGAMFQGVMNPEERRALGAHCTSEENILKLANPLFLDSLWEEFEDAKHDAKTLEAFRGKISRLKFLEIITSRMIQFDVAFLPRTQKGACQRERVQMHPLWKRIMEVGELLGIKLDDHIIVAGDEFVSAM